YVYDSFGNLTTSSGTLTNPFQYTGRDYDQETGLRYYRARYYDPAVGRFLSEDPLEFGGGINFYAYVHNSPSNRTDPLGFCDKEFDWDKAKFCLVQSFQDHFGLTGAAGLSGALAIPISKAI